MKQFKEFLTENQKEFETVLTKLKTLVKSAGYTKAKFYVDAHDKNVIQLAYNVDMSQVPESFSDKVFALRTKNIKIEESRSVSGGSLKEV